VSIGEPKRDGDADAVTDHHRVADPLFRENAGHPFRLRRQRIVGVFGIGGEAGPQRLDNYRPVSSMGERPEQVPKAIGAAEQVGKKHHRGASADRGHAEQLAGGDADIANSGGVVEAHGEQ